MFAANSVLQLQQLFQATQQPATDYFGSSTINHAAMPNFNNVLQYLQLLQQQNEILTLVETLQNKVSKVNIVATTFKHVLGLMTGCNLGFNYIIYARRQL